MGVRLQSGMSNVLSSSSYRTKMRESVATDVGNIESGDTEEHRLLFHQLSAHQFMLEREIEELQRVQEELRRERARYRELYDKAPVGYCTLSADGVILNANETTAALLGVQQSDLIGQPFERYIHLEDRERSRFRQGGNEGRMPQVQEVRMVRADGSAFLVSCRVFLTSKISKRHHRGNEYHLIITDISGFHQR